MSMNVQGAGSSSMINYDDGYKYPWKWYLKDLKQPDDNAPTVFSTFSCGGGSSMGYKRAGFKVLGNCEIDPTIAEVYKNNLHPPQSYVMDLRDFNKLESLPDNLYYLDVLDGSPPCSTFSMAGDREKAWGVQKKFAEGQKLQRLDDLFFVFLNTVKKLKPKVFIAENVTGLLRGNAKGYVNEIIKTAKSIGYDVQIFKLDASYMGVPQKRERVFFIGNRMNYSKLKLNFNEKPIVFGKVRSEHGKEFAKSDGLYKELLQKRKITDKSMADINKRLRGKNLGFNCAIYSDNDVAGTIVASSRQFRMCDGLIISDDDIRNTSSFPQDYDFGEKPAKFICGMSVPPSMMANIAHEIKIQWLKK